MEGFQSASESASTPEVMTLNAFINNFGEGLLDNIEKAHPPRYTSDNPLRHAYLSTLKRAPFAAQAEAIQAICTTLLDDHAPAGIINGEMGTGKTLMGIAATAVAYSEGQAQRFLVLSPPHLVYKWRREILDTVHGAKVWVLNGPDTLLSLLKLRQAQPHDGPEYVILGRVRMRMGYHWSPAYRTRSVKVEVGHDGMAAQHVWVKHCVCPDCYATVLNEDKDPIAPSHFPTDRQVVCDQCGAALWTLRRQRQNQGLGDTVKRALQTLPTIGKITAGRLLDDFGETTLAKALTDNVYELVNLLDEDGEFVFNQRQSERIERKLAKTQFAFGQGDFQASEFIKRYFPKGFFDWLVIDEVHEYKNAGSAQGQAMQVLASRTRQCLLLTGTLMGGYAEDLFYLLWRTMPGIMMKDGYRYHRGKLGRAAMQFSQEHGIIKEVMKVSDEGNHKTAKGQSLRISQTRAPGFGPLGVAKYVLPYTVFVKLSDMGEGVLPGYKEYFEEVLLTPDMASHYQEMETDLMARLRQALRAGDHTLLGVVMNALLAWPDCAFRCEEVKHPRSQEVLAFIPALFDANTPTPKEERLLDMVLDNKRKGRRTLVYTTYTGKRDTASRLRALMLEQNIRCSVLRATVKTEDREDWILEQVDRGIDVIITNPELVKTGLDLLEFPSIIFMQTGFNVYTLMQAARRSWRIGQKEDVDVTFLGYAETAQMSCLSLMAKKIAVTQSTSGEMPDNGLDDLNSDGDSVEVALAKSLLNQTRPC
ncbi:DEAD/DEAH box helicase [Vibrio zhanjiangensis]|uniref:DEAD/DEAH box helicase n=1 Tax=Vibrio zhanjiangensis TaxID=1046128 RepID=A0ABQ6F3T1_9VIBR|nr:DEAD/DEAH box helicase family protein [Vibrio zhanjiangensis]GLT20185.1 DEAD/DEAH box helicase [Vibrio zhanjiangensis]